MNIGIPKEIMTGESRVALTPTACAQLQKHGHRVFIQQDAGRASGYDDDEYLTAGCEIADNLSAVYDAAELIVKVKQPLEQDLLHLDKHHTVFSYLHLAADHELIRQLCSIGLTAIPFESVKDDNRQLPLLAPMSAIAGRIATIRGASLLFRNRGGSGILLGGIGGRADNNHSDIDAGNVAILGAGVAGSHAISTAVELGADVDVFDLDTTRLDRLKQQHPNITTHLSTTDTIAEVCADADLIIGAVLLAGRRAPVVLKESVIEQMRSGSVIIDIAIDQGGCVENIEATDSERLFFSRHGVLHSAVPNMPAAVPRTATQALSTAILPYVARIADGHMDDADIRAAIAIENGAVIDEVLAREFKS